MNGLTAEQRSKLLECIQEWGDSQDRIKAEQDHQAEIAAELRESAQIAEKNFKRIAKAYWSDTVKKYREDVEEQLDLFETVRGFDESRSAARWLEENGATLESRQVQ